MAPHGAQAARGPGEAGALDRGDHGRDELQENEQVPVAVWRAPITDKRVRIARNNGTDDANKGAKNAE